MIQTPGLVRITDTRYNIVNGGPLPDDPMDRNDWAESMAQLWDVAAELYDNYVGNRLERWVCASDWHRVVVYVDHTTGDQWLSWQRLDGVDDR